jgi:hypothetical protein
MARCYYTSLQALDQRCPSAVGKSSILDSGEPAPCSIDSDAMVNIKRTLSFNTWPDLPHLRLRRGDTTHRSAAELHRGPPRERKVAAPKGHSDIATTSSTPSAGHLLGPTLCTRRDPGFPHPPAAEAAGGGRGNRRIAAGEVVRTGDFRNRLSATVAGERRPHE